MSGCKRHRRAYYSCWPRGNNRGRPDKHEGHTKAVYLREDAVLDAVTRFYADRVFGKSRQELIAAELDSVDDRAARERQHERERLQRNLADIARRQDAIMRQAQDGNPDDPFSTALRSRYNDLEAQRTSALGAIAQLDAASKSEPAPPRAVDTALLDALPYLKLNLAKAPDQLVRRLFEITQLAVRMRDDSDDITIEITLPSDRVQDVAEAAELLDVDIPTQRQADQGRAVRADVVCAPDGGRTRTGSVCAPRLSTLANNCQCSRRAGAERVPDLASL
jgi:site-specific DNA recombinase